MIKAAAILQDGVIYTVPSPGRHHHVMMHMLSEGIYANRTHIQGFVDDRGLFLNREEALLVATAYGQLLRKSDSDELFSEDLW